MKFVDKAFSSLRGIMIGDKEVYVTDRHQYTLPIWTALSNETEKSYTLVSIDYHPDTNPPFWQVLTLKATLENKEEDQGYFNELLKHKISRLDRYDSRQIIDCVEELNNDEHINTAMSLGVLKDYHMINCMDEHHYETGTHYLLKEAYFGSLENSMFESINFKIPEGPMILDIDLDYFLRMSDFEIKEDSIIRTLIQKADLITVARSVKYFNYLKKDDFTIEVCENKLIELLKTYLL